MITIEPTHRGFLNGKFTDGSGVGCSIQESSAMAHNDEDGCFLWLGVDNANPLIMAVDARRLGMPTDQYVGWVPYPVPKEVLMHTRMHLNQKQVKELLPLLKHFAKHGQLPDARIPTKAKKAKGAK